MKLFNRNKKKLSDEEIVSAYQRTGNTLHMGELYERYAHLVLGLCIKMLQNKEEAHDTVSQIFEKLLLDMKKHEITHFKSWLFMVTKNQCLMILRQRSRAEKKEEAKTVFSELSLSPVDEKIQKEARIVAMEEALQQLKDNQRICLELFYLKEMSYRQIEDLTGLSNKEVKSHIQNGKRNLKIILEKQHGTAIQQDI